MSESFSLPTVPPPPPPPPPPHTSVVRGIRYSFGSWVQKVPDLFSIALAGPTLGTDRLLFHYYCSHYLRVQHTLYAFFSILLFMVHQQQCRA